MWYYETKIGIFQIYPDPENPEGYLLYIDNVYLGNYDSPEAAADAVCKRTTGWDAWDLLPPEEAPIDLSVWVVGKPA